MAPGGILDDAVGRAALVEHVGKSGAALERVTLGDGRSVVVKRVTPATDLTLAIFGQPYAHEQLLWRSGGLDRLPEGVGHAIIDGWTEGEDTTVIVMRDLGDAVLGWDDRLDARPCRLGAGARRRDAPRLPRRPARGRSRRWPRCSTCSRRRGSSRWPVTATSCWRPRCAAGTTSPTPPSCRPTCRRRSSRCTPTWAAWPTRCVEGPVTLAHGDLATVNMAFDGDLLVLLDWAVPVAAPGALDIARLLVGCAHVMDLPPDDVISTYRRAAGPAYDDRSMQLALVSALGWLGWNKALDIVESPDEAVRERERASLAWWVEQARKAIERRSMVMDQETAYRRSVEGWTARVEAVGPDQWALPTPCADWDVRTLVNHVVGEDLWTGPLMRGATMEEVGDRFDGDLLGDDPRASARTAAAVAMSRRGRDAADARQGPPVVRRGGHGGVRRPAHRRPPDPRLGPGRRPPAAPPTSTTTWWRPSRRGSPSGRRCIARPASSVRGSRRPATLSRSCSRAPAATLSGACLTESAAGPGFWPRRAPGSPPHVPVA